MAGSVYGTVFKVTTFGESHGAALGAVVDGCPAGLSLDEGYIQGFLDRRKPGQSKYSSQRKESDKVEILSGVFEGRTLGTPIAMLIRNEDQRSKDYSELKDVYRPGHADYCFDEKYGFRDYRGGGRSSGRETASRVAAGAIAIKLLNELGIEVSAFSRAIGPFTVLQDEMDLSEALNNPLCIPNHDIYMKASDFIDKLRSENESAGGIIECWITGLPVGLGEPVFDKLDAELAKAILSIGAVKGFEIGDGFNAADLTGSENNDPFISENGRICKLTNHSGGTLGGFSDGDRLVFRAAIKPTPSIGKPQKTVDSSGLEKELIIKGRHDPLIVPRAVVVVEAMAAIAIADMLLRNMASKMPNVRNFYLKDSR